MLELGEEKRAVLASLRAHPGFPVLQEVTDLLFKEANGLLLSLDRSKGATTEQIASSQEQARAYHLAYERLLAEIDRQYEVQRTAEAEGDKGGEGEDGDGEEAATEGIVTDMDYREQLRRTDG